MDMWSGVSIPLVSSITPTNEMPLSVGEERLGQRCRSRGSLRARTAEIQSRFVATSGPLARVAAELHEDPVTGALGMQPIDLVVVERPAPGVRHGHRVAGSGRRSIRTLRS